MMHFPWLSVSRIIATEVSFVSHQVLLCPTMPTELTWLHMIFIPRPGREDQDIGAFADCRSTSMNK